MKRWREMVPRPGRGVDLLPPAPAVKMETLTRFLFTSPRWQFTASAIIVIGLLIDLSGYLTASFPSPAGTILFSIPALIAFLLTTPLVTALNGAMTWNRSAFLALICSLLSITGTLGTFLLLESAIFPFLYAYTLGFIVALRLLVLTAVADYRLGRTILPASLQSVAGILVGALYFDPSFMVVAVISTVALALGGALLIWLIELPLYRAFGIHGLQFINLFLAHLTDGSRDLEKFFRAIGEEATVHQANLLIRRKDRPTILVTVPNLHPGPMGDIGGTNLPSRLHDALPGEVFVCHGCATHDFNLVADAEIEKVIAAVRGSLDNLTFITTAGPSQVCREGSVQVLCQPFGDTILIVATRSPLKTEDVDPAIGEIIMAEGRREFAHVAFVDAHNCMTDVTTPVHPSTPLAQEYIAAARAGVKACRVLSQGPFRAGAARIEIPYTRDDGFGRMGIQALVIEAGGQRTAYVLLDGNNIIQGARDVFLAPLKDLVDHAEVMTTDSHVVNTISGKNPIGLRVPPEDISRHIKAAVESAIADLSSGEAAGTTATCDRIVIFGAERISQLASTVNTIVVFLIPLSLAILILTFLLSIVAYLVMI